MMAIFSLVSGSLFGLLIAFGAIKFFPKNRPVRDHILLFFALSVIGAIGGLLIYQEFQSVRDLSDMINQLEEGEEKESTVENKQPNS